MSKRVEVEYSEPLQDDPSTKEQSPLALAVAKEFDQLREEKAVFDLKKVEYLIIADYNDYVHPIEEEAVALSEEQDLNPKVHKFSAPLIEVLDAIRTSKNIDGINLREQIQDTTFRFETEDEPKLSLIVSDTLAEVIDATKASYDNSMTKKAVEKRNENADEFARTMYEVITKLKNEKGIRSFRQTVKALNEHQIPSFKGGEWHVKTYQDLNKRWKELGLI